MSENMNVAGVIGVTDTEIILGNVESEKGFDYTTVHPSLKVGNTYPKDVRKAVSEWNAAQRLHDHSRKYPRVSVQTLDGRIVKLNYAASAAYSRLTDEQLRIVDTFYKKVEENNIISRKAVHNLLCGLNETLPEGQQFKLAHEIEVGLLDCLRGRKMVGFTYARRISDIESVMVRTLYAVANGKELKVVYKGL